MASLNSPSLEPMTMFYERMVAEKTPQLQIDFDTHVDPLLWSMTSNGGIIQIIDGGIARVGTDSVANGTARMQTRQHAFYHAGQELLVQFSARWVGTPTADNECYIGYGNASNGLFIGYNGTDFGVLRINRGTPNWTTTNFIGNATSSWLDPSKSNVYAIRAQMHYMGRIEWLVFKPMDRIPAQIHAEPWSNTNTGTTLQTASIPLSLVSVNTNGSTSNMAVETASMAVFSVGRSRLGIRYMTASAALSMGTTGDKIMITLRVRGEVMGVTSNAIGLVTSLHTATRSDRESMFVFYKNVIITRNATNASDVTLAYANVHDCSIFEVAKPSLGERIGGTLTGVVSASTASVGTAINRFTVAGVVGSTNRLVGMTVVVNNVGRTVLTSTGAVDAVVTVAGMPGIAADFNGETATLYNGYPFFTQTVSAQGAGSDYFVEENVISLSPGETITIVGVTPDVKKNDVYVALNFVEKL